MKTTTLAEIVISAQAAAQKALGAPDSLARQSVKLAEFEASGHDRLDFPNWENAFNTHLDLLTALGRQESEGTKAARRAAQPAV